MKCEVVVPSSLEVVLHKSDMMRYFVQVAQQDELRRGLATAKEEAARAEADLVEARREIEVGVKFCNLLQTGSEKIRIN